VRAVVVIAYLKAQLFVLPDLYSLLKPVDSAAYNRIELPAKCMAGTREELLTTIMDWRSRSSTLPLVCWLKGPAGSGKSAIAWTIAKRCDDKGKLAARCVRCIFL
jgi:pantothenate kinase-related protein Tda10